MLTPDPPNSREGSFSSSPTEKAIPLCVDLDGTVLKTDLLYESLVRVVKRSPWILFLLPWWLCMGGRARLKDALRRRATMDVGLLPRRSEVTSFLERQREAGYSLILVTASDQLLASEVVENLGLFDEVVGSSGSINLKGHRKREYLVERFGEKGYDYIGDSSADYSVWKSARRAIVVGTPSFFRKILRKLSHGSVAVEHVAVAKVAPKTFLKAIRIHQWSKNLLLFLPLALAHHIYDRSAALTVIEAFLAFSFCASSVYVTNDLFDLDSDRSHARKKNRPFASGQLSLLFGIILIPLLLALSALIAFHLDWKFQVALLLYLVVTSLYSFLLKQVALVDILVLSGLYTLRIFAGGLAASVVVSDWLLVFSMFFFLSLACGKRFSELFVLRKRSGTEIKGRGYGERDLEVIGGIGMNGGMLSILVLALFVTSTDVTHLYSHPRLLLGICPAILYWISRVWLLAYRGELDEDPILFAITDPMSYLVGIGTVLLMMLAI